MWDNMSFKKTSQKVIVQFDSHNNGIDAFEKRKKGALPLFWPNLYDNFLNTCLLWSMATSVLFMNLYNCDI